MKNPNEVGGGGGILTYLFNLRIYPTNFMPFFFDTFSRLLESLPQCPSWHCHCSKRSICLFFIQIALTNEFNEFESLTAKPEVMDFIQRSGNIPALLGLSYH